MRTLPRDMKDFLAPAKKSENIDGYEPKKAFQESTISSVGYTLGGDPNKKCPECTITLDDGKDNPDCYAKRIAYNGEKGVVEKYFVKFGIDGFMFDPWGPFSEGSQSKFARLHGRPTWNFREVNKKVFEYYITFLQTRNKAWKVNAEREVTNG